ncbi:helix-turn-helix domain-containing protein [Paenibacillus polymyxa]|uniref:helix-turn-helix domain-containing protein n=1 Tax=Paenibacillus polymyxa TaxID=1406 RepID=UPI0008D354FD|nr:helix-turn-helix domain-containing protein [Paenibacillus polymyxa]SEI77390.1 DNA binding domain-containing protein, excisionase family [Paenibacillus polymyxa]
MEHLPSILTVEDVMEYFRVSRPTVARAIKARKLKSYKLGGQRRIKLEWLKEYEDSLIASSTEEGETV